MTTLDKPEDFSIGRVVSRTFAALFGNIGTFLLLTALIMVPVLLLAIFLPNDAGNLRTGQYGQFFRITGTTTLVSTICTYVLQASLVQGTIIYLNGEKPTLGNSLSAGFKYFVPVIVVAVLALLGVMAGMILLIVPGIILALMWSVVVPVLVVEHPGITGAFGRSRTLTSGYRGKIFLLLLMYGLIVIAIGLVTRPLMGLALTSGAAPSALPAIGGIWIENVIFAAISSVGTAAVYYELRLVKEGAGPQQLAQAFD